MPYFFNLPNHIFEEKSLNKYIQLTFEMVLYSNIDNYFQFFFFLVMSDILQKVQTYLIIFRMGTNKGLLKATLVHIGPVVSEE
jgi:hypothetical protein